MKKITLTLILFVLSQNLIAQNYSVVYNFQQIHKKSNLISNLKSYLDGNGKQSYFLDDFNNSKLLDQNGGNNVGMNGNDYLFKDIKNNQFIFRDHIKLTFFNISDTINNINWKFYDSTKTILEYKCQKASCVLNGRKFDVFFTTELPFSDGPWKLFGLPGLILEATSDDDNGYFHYLAENIELQNKTKEFPNLYFKDEVISFEDFKNIYVKKYEEFKHKIVNEQGETRPLEKGFREYYILD
jgi:GLPGLI family protein